MKRLHVWMTGTVQGVWFRESTRQEAEAHALRGWVRNLPDGRVEAVLEGPEQAVDAVAAWCRRGPTNAVVEGFECRSELVTGEFAGFRVLH